MEMPARRWARVALAFTFALVFRLRTYAEHSQCCERDYAPNPDNPAAVGVWVDEGSPQRGAGRADDAEEALLLGWRSRLRDARSEHVVA